MALNGIQPRISGLFSGMDSADLVKSMLYFEQAKIDRQFQVKTVMEWKKDAFREVNVSLRNFREKYLSPLNPSENMFTSSAYAKYKVNMLKKTDAVTVTAGTTATAGKMTINEISQLAEAAVAKSTGVFADASFSYETSLGDLALVNGLEFVAVAGDQEGDPVREIIAFSINGQEFEFTKDDSLSKVINTVNNNSEVNVRLSLSSLTQGFTIQTKTTGASSEIKLENIHGNAFSAEDSAFGIAAGSYNGKNAKLTIENVAVEKESNTFTIDGLTYALKDTMSEAVSFTVERDIDTTFDMIVGFINGYNELVGSLQARLDEKINYAFDPLTDLMRSGLDADEIKLWEDQAKSGLLRNDSNLSRLMTELRSSFYTAITAAGKSPADIGITTGAWQQKGKIVIDENALRSALENNPDAVGSIFTSISSATDYDEKFAGSGLVTRISDLFNRFTSQVNSTAVQQLDLGISRAEERLIKLEKAMAQAESQYYRKLSAMESALATMNSQSSWLASQIVSFN